METSDQEFLSPKHELSGRLGHSSWALLLLSFFLSFFLLFFLSFIISFLLPFFLSSATSPIFHGFYFLHMLSGPSWSVLRELYLSLLCPTGKGLIHVLQMVVLNVCSSV